MFKKIQYLYLLNKYIKCNFRGQRCGTTTIVDIRRQKVNRQNILPLMRVPASHVHLPHDDRQTIAYKPTSLSSVEDVYISGHKELFCLRSSSAIKQARTTEPVKCLVIDSTRTTTSNRLNKDHHVQSSSVVNREPDARSLSSRLTRLKHEVNHAQVAITEDNRRASTPFRHISVCDLYLVE